MHFIHALLLILFSIHIHAEILTFESISKDAIAYNIELQQLNIDLAIHQSQLEIIHSAYYPSLSISFNSQYTKSLDEGSGFTSVDNNVFNDTTQYETSTSLILNQRIYDFGVLESQKAVTAKEKEIIKYRYGESRQALILKLLEIYRDTLMLFSKKEHLVKLKQIDKEIYTIQKRLYDAGEVDRLQVAQSAIEILELEEELETVQKEYDITLENLSFYTGNSYSDDNSFSIFQPHEYASLPYELSDTYSRNLLELEKKEHELSLLLSKQYPQINFYGKYSFYGSSECSTWCTFDDLSKKNYVVGISIQANLFEGLKYNHEKDKLQLELKKLKLANEQSRREYQQRIENANSVYLRIEKQRLQSKNSLDAYEDRLIMARILTHSKEREQIALLQDEIVFEKRQFEYKKIQIESTSKKKEIELINRYANKPLTNYIKKKES